jgi:hypothetical protein
MIRDEKKRFRLLYGPYEPPKTKRGRFLVCEWRGKVKVGGYSDGPITWPVKWGTRNSIILCASLLDAVRKESEEAVAHHWGVVIKVVQKWRRALGVGRLTKGTHWIMREQSLENVTPKRSRELTESARNAARRPKSGAWKRRMSVLTKARIQRNGHVRGSRLWSPDEETLLGTDADRVIAVKLGRSERAVGRRRQELGIKSRSKKPWAVAEERLLGKEPDRVVAVKLARSERAVQLRRQALGIKAHVPKNVRTPWTRKEISLIGRFQDHELAIRLGRPVSAIRRRRLRLGIRGVGQLWRQWTNFEDQLLTRYVDAEVARKTNRTVVAVSYRRRILGIANRFPKSHRWTKTEESMLGNLPDREVAKKIGITLNSVRLKRWKMRIPPLP